MSDNKIGAIDNKKRYDNTYSWEAFKKTAAKLRPWGDDNQQDTQAAIVARNHPNSVFGNGYTNNNTQYT